MKDQISISNATIDRLPLYFRTLRLAQDEGIDIISSEELGRRLGITPEQIETVETSLKLFKDGDDIWLGTPFEQPELVMHLK